MYKDSLETANYPFTKRQILDVTKLKASPDNKLNIAKMMIFFYLIEQKTLWEKEKRLVTSIFSFS